MTSSRLRLRHVAAAGAIAATLVIISGCGSDSRSGDQPVAAGAEATPPHVDGAVQAPPCDGKEQSVSDALKPDDYQITLPSDGLLNSESVEAAYLCPSIGSYFTFSSGATLEVQVNDLKNPSETWAAIAKQDPEVYTLGTNQGVPALFIQPGGGDFKDAEGGVTFVKDGLYVAVGGNTQLPLNELVDAAAALSVQPTKVTK